MRQSLIQSSNKGQWVRLVKTIYKGDVARVCSSMEYIFAATLRETAQVVRMSDVTNSVEIKLVPRVDIAAIGKDKKDTNQKRKRGYRPPQKLFDLEAVR